MHKSEYSISKISYVKADVSRVMHACLKNWLIDPKILNFVSPSLNFPFRYTQWLKLYKSITKKNIENQSYVIKKNKDLIVGHISLFVDGASNEAHLFHLIIDQKFRRNGLAQELINFAESYLIKKGTGTIRLYVSKKNKAMVNLIEKVGYLSKDKNKKFVSYKKIMI